MCETTVKPRGEQTKTVMIVEATSSGSVPQGSRSWEEAARVELEPHQWNTKEVKVVCCNMRSMAGLSPQVRPARTKECCSSEHSPCKYR